MQVRLQKYMADSGVAARRKCEEIIASGRVKVNGEKVTEMGVKVDPEKDKITLDGKIIEPLEKEVYFALNKPAGVVTTVSNKHGETTVMDLVKEVDERIFPVGRLDKDTKGLLILTTDGKLANRMMHPRYHLDKTYIVTVKHELPKRSLKYLSKGIVVGGKKTQPASVDLYKKTRRMVRYKMTIREGRKRQIRRMFKAVGDPVVELKRVSIGPVTLGRLPEGEYRPLNRKEIGQLKKETGLIK